MRFPFYFPLPGTNEIRQCICGDCRSHIFAMRLCNIKDAYHAGSTTDGGSRAAVDKLDKLLKLYVRKVKGNSSAMLDRLNANLSKEAVDVVETEQSTANLEAVLANLQEELKATKRQHIRNIMKKHPDQEKVLEETYDELETDLCRFFEGLQNQNAMSVNKRNTIVQVNRTAGSPSKTL